jgi:hypothetical protein
MFKKKTKKVLTLATCFEILRPHTEKHNTSHMRTKTLLLTAALAAAGAASTMAADVYSVNSVGYANVSVLTGPGGGFNMVTCPFVVADDHISALIPSAPDQTLVYPYANPVGATPGQFYGPWTYYGPPDNLWDPDPTVPAARIVNGGGAFIKTSQNFVITFVGEVNQGNPVGATIHNSIGTGFNMMASKVPQEGDVSALGLAAPADQTYIFKYIAGPGEGYLGPFTYYGPPDNTWDPLPLPTIKIGEALWVHSEGNQDWTRNFTVN